MKKHSPTPWIQGHSTALGTDAIFTLNPPMPVAVVMDDNREGNTEFILLAVNHHKELVGMCKDALCILNAHAVGFKTQEAIQALLAKLEVKP